MMAWGERMARVHEILIGRYDDISEVDYPPEFEGMFDPVEIMLFASQNGFLEMADDGFNWIIDDIEEYPEFKDMVELLYLEAQEFRKEHGFKI